MLAENMAKERAEVEVRDKARNQVHVHVHTLYTIHLQHYAGYFLVGPPSDWQ